MDRREPTFRVFVSSTFHDMQAERDALVKRVTVQAASAPAGGWGGFVRRSRELAGEPDIVFHGEQVPSADEGGPETAKRAVLLEGPSAASGQ